MPEEVLIKFHADFTALVELLNLLGKINKTLNSINQKLVLLGKAIKLADKPAEEVKRQLGQVEEVISPKPVKDFSEEIAKTREQINKVNFQLRREKALLRRLSSDQIRLSFGLGMTAFTMVMIMWEFKAIGQIFRVSALSGLEAWQDLLLTLEDMAEPLNSILVSVATFLEYLEEIPVIKDVLPIFLTMLGVFWIMLGLVRNIGGAMFMSVQSAMFWLIALRQIDGRLGLMGRLIVFIGNMMRYLNPMFGLALKYFQNWDEELAQTEGRIKMLESELFRLKGLLEAYKSGKEEEIRKYQQAKREEAKTVATQTRSTSLLKRMMRYFRRLSLWSKLNSKSMKAMIVILGGMGSLMASLLLNTSHISEAFTDIAEKLDDLMDILPAPVSETLKWGMVATVLTGGKLIPWLIKLGKTIFTLVATGKLFSTILSTIESSTTVTVSTFALLVSILFGLNGALQRSLGEEQKAVTWMKYWAERGDMVAQATLNLYRWAEKLPEPLSSIVSGFADVVTGLHQLYYTVQGFLRNIGDEMRKFVNNVKIQFGGWIGAVLSGLQTNLLGFTTSFLGIGAVFQNVVASVLGFFNGVYKSLSTIIGSIITGVEGFINEVKRFFSIRIDLSWLNNLFPAFKTVANNILSLFSSLPMLILAKLKELPSFISNIFAQIKFPALEPKVPDISPEVMKNFVEPLLNFSNWLGNVFKNLLASIWAKILGVFQFIGSGRWINVLLDFLGWLKDAFFSGIKGVWNGIVETITTIWSGLVSRLQSAFQGFINWLGKQIQNIAKFFQDLYNVVVGHSIWTDMLKRMEDTTRTSFDNIGREVKRLGESFKFEPTVTPKLDMTPPIKVLTGMRLPVATSSYTSNFVTVNTQLYVNQFTNPDVETLGEEISNSITRRLRL